MPKVMIEPASYEECQKAVDKAFDLFSPRIKDKRILIKPNVLRGAKATEAITTHPALLRAVVERVEVEQPAEIVVGDNPGLFGYGANEVCFNQTGLMDAARGYYRNLSADPADVPFDGGLVDRLTVSKAVLDADVFISLPKFKTHGLTAITGAIKNHYGIIPGGQKSRLHGLAKTPWRFCELVVDVFLVRPADLYIMDGVLGMEGNGPASKDLRDIGVVLASDDAWAMDAVMARMMGVEPGALRIMQAARERGLGDYSEDTIDVVGEFFVVPDFKLPPLVTRETKTPQEIEKRLAERSNLRPRVEEELCTGCRTCVEQCPASALTLAEAVPLPDDNLCLTCFCCQEMCPEQAIKVDRPLTG